MNQITCSNCKNTITENYCQHCGQRYINKRITFFNIVSDYVSQILSLERSGFATIIQLFIRPKMVIDNYFNGFRNFYQGPGRILFYFFTVAGLHLLFVNKRLLGATISTNSEFLSPQILLVVLTIPILTLISYVAFKKHKHNFSEHFIAQTYLFSALGILFILLDDIISLFTLELDFFSFFELIFVVLFWSALTFSKKRKWYFIVLNFLLLLLILLVIIGLFFLLGQVTNFIDFNA